MQIFLNKKIAYFHFSPSWMPVYLLIVNLFSPPPSKKETTSSMTYFSFTYKYFWDKFALLCSQQA
jgi:hypothetical protein